MYLYGATRAEQEFFLRIRAALISKKGVIGETAVTLGLELADLITVINENRWMFDDLIKDPRYPSMALYDRVMQRAQFNAVQFALSLNTTKKGAAEILGMGRSRLHEILAKNAAIIDEKEPDAASTGGSSDLR